MRRALIGMLLCSGCAWRAGHADLDIADAPAELAVFGTSADDDRWYVAGNDGWVWFVDTGYTVTTCDDDWVEQFGLPTGGRYRTRGLAGRVKGHKARMESMSLGPHQLADVVCAVRDLGSTSSIADHPEAQVAGVLGMDVLGRFTLVLDSEAGVLQVWSPDAETHIDAAVEIPTRRLSGPGPGRRYKVPLHLEDRTLWPLFDTGANRSLLATGLEPTQVRKGVTVGGTGGSGGVVQQLAYVRLEQAMLGNHPLPALVVAEAFEHLNDGLLGLDVLGTHHWMLHGPSGLLWMSESSSPFELPAYRDWQQTPRGHRFELNPGR